ncbi:MAG: ABC transporter permease, partial [Acidobacteria bacterium]|nr:ABC transporter permease [Acidobacteriota bacterium]
MSNLMHDLRYAIRMLAKAPAFTAMVVLTLALGIGANTAIFSLAYAIFRQAPPVSDPDSLVFIDQSLAWRKDSTQFTLSFVDYQYFREHNTSFADLAAHYSTSPMHLVVDGEPQAINASVVTSNYFGILGLQPAIGRFFVPEEDAVQGRNPVVVVSYSLWQNRLGA